MYRNIFRNIFVFFLIIFSNGIFCAEGEKDTASIMNDVQFKDGILVYYPSTKKEQIYTIPDGIIGIHQSAFSEAENLKCIVIPKSCKYIGVEEKIPETSWSFNPFFSSGSITHIVVNRDNPYFSSQGGILFTKDNSVLLKYPFGRQNKHYDVPIGVITIGEAAFQYSCLETVNLPHSLQYIYSEAFYETNLYSLILPEGLLAIGS